MIAVVCFQHPLRYSIWMAMGFRHLCTLWFSIFGGNRVADVQRKGSEGEDGQARVQRRFVGCCCATLSSPDRLFQSPPSELTCRER
jgi:hypothetical protein